MNIIMVLFYFLGMKKQGEMDNEKKLGANFEKK